MTFIDDNIKGLFVCLTVMYVYVYASINMSQRNGLGFFKVNILEYISTLPPSQVRYLLTPSTVNLDLCG